MKAAAVALVLLAGTLAAPAGAQRSLTVGELRAACAISASEAADIGEPATAYRVGNCAGLTRGLIAVMGLNCLLLSPAAQAETEMKIRLGVSPEAARDAFIAWADAHPQFADELGEAGMMRALVDAFPCETPAG